jgi:hypothetical protein
MAVVRIPPRRHPRIEVTCPPLRWRVVGRHAVRASAAAVVSGAAGALLLARWHESPARWEAAVAAGLIVACAASLLRLMHVVNAAHTPITFKVANGELLITRPFLFTRRRRRVLAADVRAVNVSVTPGEADGPFPVARMSIRRRRKLTVRVPGRRPLDELDHVARELRAALRV